MSKFHNLQLEFQLEIYIEDNILGLKGNKKNKNKKRPLELNIKKLKRVMKQKKN